MEAVRAIRPSPVLTALGGILRWVQVALLSALLSPLVTASQEGDEIFWKAYNALVAEDRYEYLRLRPELAPAGVSEERRVFLDLFAIPVQSLDDALRLERIEEWLGEYEEASSWRARLAIEGADTARILKRWDLSSSLLERAERDLGSPPTEPTKHWVDTRAWLHDVRGVLVREMGLFDVAATELAAQEVWASRSVDVALKINYLFNRATLAMNQDRGDELRAILEEAEATFGDDLEPSGWQLLRFLAGLGFVEEAHREGLGYEQAQQTLRGVVSAEDSSAYQKCKAQLNLVQVDLLNQRWKSAAEGLREYERLASRVDQVGIPAEVLRRHLVGLRAWLTLDGPEGVAIDTTEEVRGLVDEAIDRQFESWRAAPIRSTGIGYDVYLESKLLLDASIRLRLRAQSGEEGRRAAMQFLIRQQSHGTLARTLGLDAPSLEEVEQGLIRPGQGLLAVQAGYERSWVFAWDDLGIEVYAVAPESELENAAKALQAAALACVAGDLDDSTELGIAEERLRRTLLPVDLVKTLNSWSSVQIVGADSLGWVPFELLRCRDGERLGKTHAVSYVPSIPLGVHLARRESSGEASDPPKLLLAAATEVGEEALQRWSVPSLASAESEILALGRAYGPGCTVLAGKALDAETLRTSLSGFDVAQLVAHGIFDPRRVRPAGLLLSRTENVGAEVWTDDLDGWLWPRLVLLSSCGVHRGPMRRGDDGRSLLVGSLFQGGAKGVLLPYVDLDLDPHLRLSREFHDALLRDALAPPEALRRARIKAGERLQHHLVHFVGVAPDPIVDQPAAYRTKARTRWGMSLVLLLAGIGTVGWLAARMRRVKATRRVL